MLVMTNLYFTERVESLKPSLEVGSLTKMETLEPRVAELTRIQVEREAGRGSLRRVSWCDKPGLHTRRPSRVPRRGGDKQQIEHTHNTRNKCI